MYRSFLLYFSAVFAVAESGHSKASDLGFDNERVTGTLQSVGGTHETSDRSSHRGGRTPPRGERAAGNRRCGRRTREQPRVSRASATTTTWWRLRQLIARTIRSEPRVFHDPGLLSF
jgi:hypothetical protein